MQGWDVPVNLEATNAFLTEETQKWELKNPRVCIFMHCSPYNHVMSDIYSLIATVTCTTLQTRRYHRYHCTHCISSDCRFWLITLTRMNEKRAAWENTYGRCCRVWTRGVETGVVGGGVDFAHLLSRQQIHSADGDELGDVCTATIFPDRVWWWWCYRRRLPFPVVGGR